MSESGGIGRDGRVAHTPATAGHGKVYVHARHRIAERVGDLGDDGLLQHRPGGIGLRVTALEGE